MLEAVAQRVFRGVFGGGSDISVSNPLPTTLVGDGEIALSGLPRALAELVGWYWKLLGQVIPGETQITNLVSCENGVVLATGGNLGIIRRSTDYGLTFPAAFATGQPSVWKTTYLENGIVLAGLTGGRMVRSTDYGVTWTQLGVVAPDVISGMVYVGNGVVLAGTNATGNLLRSADYGATWIDLGVNVTGLGISAMVYLGNGIVLLGTWTSCHIARSIDSGATWVDLGVAYPAGIYIADFAHLSNGRVVAGASKTIGPGLFEGDILTSDDNGLTWVNKGVPGTATAEDVFSLVELFEGIVLCGTKNAIGHISVSTNYGESWTDCGNQIPGDIRILSLCNPGKGVVLAGGGTTGWVVRTNPAMWLWTLLHGRLVTTVFTLLAGVVEQDALVVTFPNQQELDIELDFNNLTQQCIIREYSQVNGANYRQISAKTFPIDFDNGTTCISLHHLQKGQSYRVTLQSVVTEGADRAITILYGARV